MADESDSDYVANDSSESSEDDNDIQSLPKIDLKQSKTNEKKPLFCYHCGQTFPNTKKLIKHFAKVYGSSLKPKKSKKKNVEVSSKTVKVTKKIHSLSQEKDTDTKYLCQFCNTAFTKHGSKLHRLKEHSDLPKYSQLYKPILVKRNKKVDAVKPKIDEEKANRSQDKVTQVLSDSSVDDGEKESNIENSSNITPKKRKQKESNTEDTQNITPKKRKTDEKKEGNCEKPLIFKCSKCGFHFTTAETIDKHFKDCKIKPKDSSTCDFCRLKFTKDELINHLVKHHVLNKYEKFNILAVSNASLITENTGNGSKNNTSTSKKNFNNSDCSDDEFEPKINLAISKQDKQSSIRSQQTKTNKSQEIIINASHNSNSSQTRHCNFSKSQKNTVTKSQDDRFNKSYKKHINTSQNISVEADTGKTPIKNLPNKNTNISQTININKGNTKNNTSVNNTTNSSRDLLEFFNVTRKPHKICHRRKTYYERTTKEVAPQTGLCSSSNMEHISGVTRAEIHTQMEQGSDHKISASNTSKDNRILTNFLEALNLAQKPKKISRYPERRKTYNGGITFNIDEAATQKDLDNNSNMIQNIKKRADALTENDNSSSKPYVKMIQSPQADTQKRTAATSEEICTYRETEIEERTQNKVITNDKLCVKIHLNRAEMTNEKIQQQGHPEKDSHGNAQCLLEQDAQNAKKLIANNTQTDIELCKNMPEEQKQFNLYKCGECNVNFLTQSTCYKHMSGHKHKDPTECSKCTDCGFVFSNYSLGKHKRNNCPKDHIDKVLVEEYRLNTKDDKVAIDVYHIKYNIQSLNSAEIESSVSVTEITNSENVGSYDCDQLNANASRFEMTADNEDDDLHVSVSKNSETNVDMRNVSENTVQTNISREKDTDVNASEKLESSNAIKDINGQNLAKEDKDRNVHNVSEKTVQTKHGKENETDVSERENTELQNAVEDKTGQNPLTVHKDIRLQPSQSEMTENNATTVLIEQNNSDDNVTLQSIDLNSTVEKENKETESDIESTTRNIFENKLEQDVINKKCTGSTIVLENSTKIQNKESVSTKNSEILNSIKTTEENIEAPNVRREDKTNLSADTSESHETENAGRIQENSTEMYPSCNHTENADRIQENSTAMHYGKESNTHGDSILNHNSDIAIIIKTETVTENYERRNNSVKDGNNETVALNIFGKDSNSISEESIHDVVEIYDSYFEENNVVTVIDSDDDTDCQIINVEMQTTSKSNRKRNMNQQNIEIPCVTDENSNFSDATMILENYQFSQPNYQDSNTSIKMEFDKNMTEEYLDIKKENVYEESTENYVTQSSEKTFMSENVKKENEITHIRKRRNKDVMRNYLQISLRENVNRSIISDSDDDDIIFFP